jgi:nucleoside diphosphate kinase
VIKSSRINHGDSVKIVIVRMDRVGIQVVALQMILNTRQCVSRSYGLRSRMNSFRRQRLTSAVKKVLTRFNTRGSPCNHILLHGSLFSEWLPQ